MSVEFISGIYPWIKALHVIFVIFWMASLFMLPRFYAYHVEDMATDHQMDQRWQQREVRLLRIIINPAMILVWILGLALAYLGDYWPNPWFYIKATVVLLLTSYHGYLAMLRKAFVRGQNTHSSKFYRLMNEIPGVAVILIVILVIVKPWG